MPAQTTLNMWALITRIGGEWDIQLYDNPPTGSINRHHVIFLAEIMIPANVLAQLPEPVTVSLTPI